ncbi:cytochrome P450 [Nocardia cyriacigeorgica]|uniref:cytochrome P450 family protein n=1 Tax=Nocardia cyriacigeorgica TaxID=135487 RepID=UPI0018941DDF|nr:cytochrome P450 [Nocardia cyriacigeorgica]MBF6102283.1 cytochrome P450 [Nocardia cyriacigeorgica]
MSDLHPASVPAPVRASAAFVLDTTGADILGEAISLRNHGPLVHVLLPGDIPAWAVTDAETMKELFTDWRVSKDAHQHWPRFRAGQVPSEWPLITWVSVRNMFTAYGKEHQRLRKLIGPAFTPRRVTALRPQIKQITVDLLNDLATRPVGAVVDLREDYAIQVPLRVITALMGVPSDLQGRLRVCVDEIFSTTPQRDPHDTFTELVATLTTLVKRRRAEPGDDMTSLLIGHRDNDDRLTEEELVHTLLLVISAGYETTVNLIDQAVYQVLTRPELLGQLRTGAITWSQLVEETLRHAPPVANLPLRYAITDIDIADVQIKAGEALIAAIAAANRDPDRHEPNPDAFDPARPNKEHLSFGYGPHHCLGAALARLEAVEALPALFGRLPELTLAVGAGELTPLPSFISHGHRSLPVYLDGVGADGGSTAESGR